MERFHLKKLNDMEVKEQYQVDISNMFAALQNLVLWISIGVEVVLERM
jgi:hypothetical protein